MKTHLSFAELCRDSELRVPALKGELQLFPSMIHRIGRCSLPLILGFCASGWMAPAMAEPESLSDADRVALLEKLEKIEKQSNDRVSGLYQRAIQDYQRAIQSDDATMDLYLKCTEKVKFDDEKRKSQEFRDWKRKNKEKLNSGSMRKALRFQLSWLLLSIEAAQSNGDMTELGSRAVLHLERLFKNADSLEQHQQILKQNAMGSVFAQAYQLHINVKDWPKSAIDMDGIYEKVVMPPLRNKARIQALRSAWSQRIQYETQVVEKWGGRRNWDIRGESDNRKTSGKNSPEYLKFMTEGRPRLKWKMELDCYASGDQRDSALRMLKHLETHMSHPDAPLWIGEFQGLVDPSEVDPPEE